MAYKGKGKFPPGVRLERLMARYNAGELNLEHPRISAILSKNPTLRRQVKRDKRKRQRGG